MKILITGATGQLGGAVIETLLTKLPASQVAALVRSLDKAEGLWAKGVQVFPGSYDDVAALKNAMLGTDKVLLISAGDEGDRVQQHKNVIDAAQQVGVPFIAYTSRALRDRASLCNQLMEDHFKTEDMIRASGLQHTIFRNVLYMDAIPLFAGRQVFERGIGLPAGEGKVAFALRSEMGEAMANVLLAPQAGDKTYTFTGSAAYSFHDVAEVLTQLSGKEVRYTPIEKEAFRTRMEAAGLPAAMVAKIIDFNADIQNGQEAAIFPDLESALGRRPASLAAGLKQLFQL